MAKTSYSFEKRQRDLAKKRKQEEKRQRKLANKVSNDDGRPDAAADLSTTPASGEGGPTKVPV
ncbi:MAG: hypothetical protein KDH15_17765 [Rhodocyclaceae bacterium]|nr:hypothetical protein [Rhodocyclaceae bacterium]